MYTIISKKDDAGSFLAHWREYIKNNLATFRYLPEYLDYMLYYSSSLEGDGSFVAIENGKPVGVCFLPIEKAGGIARISLAGGYTLAPLCANDGVEKYVFEEIDRISKKHNVKKVLFYIDPLIAQYRNKFNCLRKYRFVDTSSSDCILDLRKNEKELLSGVRKGHKYDIGRVLKDAEFQLICMDHSNADRQIHETYRELHKKCSGKATRAKETFEKQFDMLKSDNAMLVGVKFKDKFVSMSYFLHFQKTVLYMSSADDPDFKGMPVYHPGIWKAILYYASRGFDFMQFSQPCGYGKVGGFDDYLDEKQLNISKFKRGFGGEMVTFFRGIRYYDASPFLEDLQNFKDKMLKSFGEREI